MIEDERAPREVLEDLAALLRDFPGRPYFGEIGRETRFFDDLGMASIDAVVLGEQLERRYGLRFPFHELLSELQARRAEDLEVGELADFVHRHLTRRPAEG